MDFRYGDHAGQRTRAGRRARFLTLLAMAAVTAGSLVGSASGNAPLRVCPTCTYTTIPAALTAAAAQSGQDLIQIAPGTYSGDPEDITITSDVTLQGAGTGQTTLASVVVVEGVTTKIAGVMIDAFGQHVGVQNAGTLTLKSSLLTGNLACSIWNRTPGSATVRDSTVTGGRYWGTGICNDGTLALKGSTVTDNYTDGAGGGIFNTGTLTVRDSTISGNTAGSWSHGGGGIYNGAGATLIISNSAISQNEAYFYGVGGGICNFGAITVSDSTVDGNYARYQGGGIYNGAAGSATAKNTVVTRNWVSTEPFPQVPGGGGIYNSGALTLLGVTVTGNSGPDPGLLNEGGTLTIKDSTIQP